MHCGKPPEAAHYQGHARIFSGKTRIWSFFEQNLESPVLQGMQR